jgi:hypothetical protein
MEGWLYVDEVASSTIAGLVDGDRRRVDGADERREARSRAVDIIILLGKRRPRRHQPCFSLRSTSIPKCIIVIYSFSRTVGGHNRERKSGNHWGCIFRKGHIWVMHQVGCTKI